MDFFLIIRMTIFIFVLKPDKAEQNVDYHWHYKNFIKTVTDHIRSSIESNEIRNLILKLDSNYTIKLEEAFQSDLYLNNFRYNYSNTISVLNFKYTGILKIFLNYLDIILQQCKQFRDENLWENFICCITSLVEEVKNSQTMLDNLYNVMKYISDIDVRYLFQGKNVPNAIVDEIDFFKQFVLQYTSETVSFDLNSLPNLKDSETKFKNLNEFYTEASEIVNNMFQNSNVIDTSVETNSITNQINECTNENDSYLVYLTCSNLNAFYNKTIEIWYKNLDFEEFLKPKIPQFIPPIDLDINQNDGIKALNILRQESGWKTMNHILIIYNGKQFSVDFIMKDEINNINFRVKKEHVIQLLRCRYTEIMKNYEILLSTVVHICNKSVPPYYQNCLIELFDSLNKSKRMFDGLNMAINTLNNSSIWSLSNHSHSSLQKILKWNTDFLNLLKNNEFSRCELGNNIIKNEGKNTEKLKKLRNILSEFRDNFYKELRSEMSRMNDRCVMRKPFIEKFKIMNDILLMSTYPYSNQIYLNASNYFGIYCENVYKNCYEDLGFGKIQNLNTSLHDRYI
ncbi:uncharacterized protein LOC126893903 [Daktulosphaira vitifoliae]|uniref:uncharacterized protein LOC126893903 n=1 Tax=Daktulosphaira vitifoliae TaxID=58002 RepID=UPI0021A9AF4E|nr:uncharacterized protein LOC126893903 [Daktulosphaira vitifoliae]